MTDEERQRTMDFILSQQAKFSVDIEKSKESDDEIRRLLAEQREQFNEQLGRSNERLSRVEALIEQNALQQSHMNDVVGAVIERQDRTSEDIRNLTAVVNRIADAVAVLIDRDNAANGDRQT